MLDTHVVLWWFADEPLDPHAREAVAAPKSEVFVSAVSIWELEIKKRLGKLSTNADLAEQCLRGGFLELPVEFAHAVAAGALPQHHRDPFDRMLVAQAQVEGLTVVTRDRALSAYDIPLLAA